MTTPQSLLDAALASGMLVIARVPDRPTPDENAEIERRLEEIEHSEAEMREADLREDARRQFGGSA